MTQFVRDDVQAFTATGAGNAINPLPNTLPLVFSLEGTFAGTVAIQYQHGSEGAWFTSADAAHTLTAPGLVLVGNPGPGTQVRMNCTAFTSGTINARLTHQQAT